MDVLDHFYQWGTGGDQVLAVWDAGETLNMAGEPGWDELLGRRTWGVYWSDSPGLEPVGYSFIEFFTEAEAKEEFLLRMIEESNRRT